MDISPLRRYPVMTVSRYRLFPLAGFSRRSSSVLDWVLEVLAAPAPAFCLLCGMSSASSKILSRPSSALPKALGSLGEPRDNPGETRKSPGEARDSPGEPRGSAGEPRDSPGEGQPRKAQRQPRTG